MAEYIEREAANFAIQKKMQEYINKSVQSIGFAKYREDSFFTNAALGCRAAIEEVNSISAADVRPVVRGKWIWDDEGYHCSECFYHAYGETGEVLSGHWHFCPNCGADMREES